MMFNKKLCLLFLCHICLFVSSCDDCFKFSCGRKCDRSLVRAIFRLVGVESMVYFYINIRVDSLTILYWENVNDHETAVLVHICAHCT